MAGMELEVPANLYGMAIAEPPQLSRKHDGTFLCMMELSRVYFLLFVNYFVCLLFILQVKLMNNAHVYHCTSNMVVLEFICVFIFEVQMLAELQESFSMVTLLWHASGPSNSASGTGSRAGGSTSTLRLYAQARETSPTHGAVLAQEESRSWMRRLKQRLRRSGEGPEWTLDGLSHFFKAWSTIAVALPKLLLGIAVAYTGGVYIIKSSDEESMVMNTLSVVFIAEIDEILYVAFTSSVMRYHLENMAAVEVGLSNRKRLGLWFVSGTLAPLLMALVSIFLMWQTRQQECGGQDWTPQNVREEIVNTFQAALASGDPNSGGLFW